MHGRSWTWLYIFQSYSTGLPFIRPMRNVSTVAGSDVVLECRVTGYPVKEVYWTKGKGFLIKENILIRIWAVSLQPVVHTSSYTFIWFIIYIPFSDSARLPSNHRQELITDGKLKIQNIDKRQDSGVYVCWASNEDGYITSANLSLTVMGMLRLRIQINLSVIIWF